MAQTVETEIRSKTELDEHTQGRSTVAPASEVRREFLPRKKSRARIILPVAGLVVAAAAAIYYYFYAGWESTDDAQIDGYINPINARISGYVTNVYVDDNEVVKAGTLLVRIDPKDYQVALDSAKAALANDRASAAAARVNVPITSVNTTSQLRSAEADVENARAGVAAAEKQYEAARAALMEGEANLAKAQDDVKRYQQLVAKEEISQQQYVQAVTTAQAAEAAVARTRASAAASEHDVTQARSKLQQAQASLEYARTGPHQVAAQKSRALAADATVERSAAGLEQAQLNLDYTKVHAPVDGVVAKRSAQVGQYVQPGQQLMAVIPLDNIWVTANFKETQLKNMRPGQPAKISVDAYGRDYNGRVESIAGGTGAIFSLLPPENATGNYVKVVQRVPVRIRFSQGQDPQHLLRPGMSVEPKVKVN